LEQCELLHNTAGIPHSLLVKFPESLTSNVYSSKHRSNLAACIRNLSDVVRQHQPSPFRIHASSDPDPELSRLKNSKPHEFTGGKLSTFWHPDFP
jgi:hypothetical protein